MLGNNTAVDVLCYTSPKIQQRIVDVVRKQINNIFQEVKKQYPKFTGQVSLIGHSLGSVIAYDLLKENEHLLKKKEPVTVCKDWLKGKCTLQQCGHLHEFDLNRMPMCTFVEQGKECSHPECLYKHSKSSTELKLPEVLDFIPNHVFLLGSPLGLFLMLRRELDENHEQVRFLHKSEMYHIFHPSDPVAYRLEPLLNVSHCSIC